MQKRQINSVHPSTKFDQSHRAFHHAPAVICLTSGKIVTAGRHLSTCMRYLRPRERRKATLGNRCVGLAARAAYPWCSQALWACKSRQSPFVSLFPRALCSFPDHPKIFRQRYGAIFISIQFSPPTRMIYCRRVSGRGRNSHSTISRAAI